MQQAGSYLDYDEDPPRTISRKEQEKTGMVKRTNRDTFVAPDRRQNVAYPMPSTGDSTILDLSDALRAQNLNEQTDPLTRSLAFVVRVGLLIVLLGGLAFGLVLLLMTGDVWGWAIIVFGAIAIAGYYLLNKLDFEHSPAGVEKDKIQAIERVTLDRQRGERQLRRKILNAYLRSMEANDDQPTA